MLKRVISVLLLTTMVLCSCFGCAKKNEGKVVSDTPVVATDGEAESNASIKFGLICLHDEQSTYDKNFIDAFKAACEGMNVEYEIKTGIPETNECYEAALDLVDRGCNLIFADSFGHESFVIQAAREHPEVDFMHATGTMAHTEGLPNYHNAFASIYQGRYLAGVVAGIKLKDMIEKDGVEPHIGYVSAFPYAECCSGYTSWYLGVKSIVPEVVMDVTFTGSWYDEALEKEAASMLINNGCVLISQHADSMGCPTACEEAGVPDVSYNGSLLNVCPKTSLVSSKINWEPYFKEAIELKMNKSFNACDTTGSLENGSVVVTELNMAILPEGADKIFEQAKQDMLDGKIKVFDTNNFTVDGKKLESYMADVDTDENYEPDTEVIKDGEFKESVYRSAPYFDITIDGINVITGA